MNADSSKTGPVACAHKVSISLSLSFLVSSEFCVSSSLSVLIAVTSSRRTFYGATLSPMSLNKRIGALLSLAVILIVLLDILTSCGISV